MHPSSTRPHPQTLCRECSLRHAGSHFHRTGVSGSAAHIIPLQHLQGATRSSFSLVVIVPWRRNLPTIFSWSIVGQLTHNFLWVSHLVRNAEQQSKSAWEQRSPAQDPVTCHGNAMMPSAIVCNRVPMFGMDLGYLQTSNRTESGLPTR